MYLLLLWIDFKGIWKDLKLNSFVLIFRTLCTMCQFKQSFNKFTLRGLCLDSKHDTVFFLERTPGAMPYFKGISSSIIRWNTTRNTWILNHLRYTAPAYLADDPVVRVFIKLVPVGFWLLIICSNWHFNCSNISELIETTSNNSFLLFWPFTVQINFSSNLTSYPNFQPSA